MTETSPVVVGTDGSEVASRAVRWASELAAAQGRPLVVVHAWLWPLLNVPLGPAPGAPADAGLRNQAERTLREALELARTHAPGVEVLGKLVTATPAAALRKQAESAAAVVIGSEGLGGVGSLLLGSVGVDLAGHAACPVVIVRGESNPDGPVVVGIDDSPRSEEAIGAAFAEASRRGAVLRAVSTWSTPALMPDWPEGAAELLRAEEAQAGRVVDDALARWSERYPDVNTEALTQSGSPRHVLVEQSHDAQLVVVGTRGRGGFRGLVLGSTSQALIHHATCPVMVVPHRVDLEDAGHDEEIEAADVRL